MRSGGEAKRRKEKQRHRYPMKCNGAEMKSRAVAMERKARQCSGNGMNGFGKVKHGEAKELRGNAKKREETHRHRIELLSGAQARHCTDQNSIAQAKH